MAKIHHSRTAERTHIVITIENGKENPQLFNNIKKALIKMKRLFKFSYVITEVDFLE